VDQQWTRGVSRTMVLGGGPVVFRTTMVHQKTLFLIRILGVTKQQDEPRPGGGGVNPKTVGTMSNRVCLTRQPLKVVKRAGKSTAAC